MIQNKTARRIMYEWHGGQWSAFYAASSSGLVASFDAIRAEITDCLNIIINNDQQGYTKQDYRDYRDLVNLTDWINTKEKTSDVIASDSKEYYALPWSNTK